MLLTFFIRKEHWKKFHQGVSKCKTRLNFSPVPASFNMKREFQERLVSTDVQSAGNLYRKVELKAEGEALCSDKKSTSTTVPTSQERHTAVDCNNNYSWRQTDEITEQTSNLRITNTSSPSHWFININKEIPQREWIKIALFLRGLIKITYRNMSSRESANYTCHNRWFSLANRYISVINVPYAILWHQIFS